jgi:hypothetical protein
MQSLCCDFKHVPSPSLCLQERGGSKDPALRAPSLSPPAENSIPLRILYERYSSYLTESNLIKVRGLLMEPAANSYLLAERDLYLENPEIKIRVRGRLGPRKRGGIHLCPCNLETSGVLKSWAH